MNGHRIIALGALLGAAAVGLGAFGAHGLRARVSADMLAVFETAVRYHFYHALALVLLGVFAEQTALRAGIDAAPRGAIVGAWCFFLGIVLFSGSLYALVFSGIRWLGAITPFGGILFIAGWLAFSVAALRR